MRHAFSLLLLGVLLLLAACASRPAPEPEAAASPAQPDERLVVLGNLNRAVGGFAKLEYALTFADDQGAAWFRGHKNDFAMTLLEALSVERFSGLNTPEGREAFAARMTALANRELAGRHAEARLERYELR